MFLAESLEVNLYRNRSYAWSKIEETIFVSSEPFSHISAVGHSSREPYHPYLPLLIHS